MVEWKKIGDVCEVITGGEVPDDTIKGQTIATKEHPYAVYTNGKEIYGFSKTYQVECDAVCISSIGANTGAVFYKLGKFTPAIRLKVLIPHIELKTKYLYYAACLIDFKGKNTGSVPNINADYVKNKVIPLVSLSEQERIVGILDTFTSSIDNLKQQIAQRRKQFNWLLDKFYYADKYELLDVTQKEGVEIKTFDEIGTFMRGRRFVRTDIVDEGVPCIHYGDMYTYYGVSADETPTHLTKEKASKLRFASKGDVVIVGAGENDIDIGVGVAWLGKEDVVVHDACFIFKHNMDPKYISYFTRSMNYHLQIRMGVVDGKICSISAKELGRTLIPIRTPEEQSRIVSSLDTIEASIQNLEAQLSQREKQYEYYRNKLLTFE